MIISKSTIIEEILLITKSTSFSTCWNYPPVVLRDAKTTPIDVEYEIQHSHISLFVADGSCASRQVSYK